MRYALRLCQMTLKNSNILRDGRMNYGRYVKGAQKRRAVLWGVGGE